MLCCLPQEYLNRSLAQRDSALPEQRHELTGGFVDNISKTAGGYQTNRLEPEPRPWGLVFYRVVGTLLIDSS